jgi:hypothetical protein
MRLLKPSLLSTTEEFYFQSNWSATCEIMHMFGENSSYVTIFLYLNRTEATKIEWKLWKWPCYFETIYSLKHMYETVLDKCSLDIVLKEIA